MHGCKGGFIPKQARKHAAERPAVTDTYVVIYLRPRMSAGFPGNPIIVKVAMSELPAANCHISKRPAKKTCTLYQQHNHRRTSSGYLALHRTWTYTESTEHHSAHQGPMSHCQACATEPDAKEETLDCWTLARNSMTQTRREKGAPLGAWQPGCLRRASSQAVPITQGLQRMITHAAGSRQKGAPWHTLPGQVPPAHHAPGGGMLGGPGIIFRGEQQGVKRVFSPTCGDAGHR